MFSSSNNSNNISSEMKPQRNVIQFYGYCVHERRIFMVTELCRGGSLLSLLQSDAQINESTILKILFGIASGLDHLHKQGIVHRDLAARNILLTENMEVKVSDFGMSKVVGNSGNDSHKTMASIGPIRWMAPEFIIERLYSTKSDVWSFGVVIYEVAMRKPPYTNLTNEQVILHVCNNTQLPLDKPVQYPKLAELMENCMNRDPKKRPSFETITQQLKTI